MYQGAEYVLERVNEARGKFLPKNKYRNKINNRVFFNFLINSLRSSS